MSPLRNQGNLEAVVSTKKRGADAQRVRDAEVLLDRRYFSLEPERWAAFQAALER